MATSSVPISDKLPALQSCLSSDYGSEQNDEFPNALVLDAAHAPIQSISRKASTLVVELIRKATGSLKPHRNESPVGDQTSLAPDEEVAATAAATTEKVDGPRIPVRPAEARSSASSVRSQAASLSERGSALSRKLSDWRGWRASRDGPAPQQWKPHETILKALGYRPAGHGRPFEDRYTLGEVLGTGGFGVVREGEYSSMIRT